jgi:hypothetical protein
VVVARALVVAASALLLVACGSSTATTAPTETSTPLSAPTEAPAPSEAPPSKAPPASVAAEPGPSLATEGRIVDTANGYAVTLPDGWVRLDLSGEDVDQFLQSGVDAMAPEAAEAFKEQVRSAAASGIKLFAIDQNGITPEFVTNANVLVIPTGGVSLDLIESTVVSQLETTLPNINGEIETERVTLPSGEALHISYVLGLQPEGGSDVDVAIHQFLMVGDTSGVYLTVSGLPGDETADKALELAQTFEFVD